jgi:hypothetical protein
MVTALYIAGYFFVAFNVVTSFFSNPKPAVVALPFALFLGAAVGHYLGMP